MILPYEHQHRRIRRFRHEAATRAFRWLARKRLIRKLPGIDFGIRHHPIRIARLPRELARLRICHLTDLHVGTLLTPNHLPGIVEAVNATESDIIAVTGDLLDNSQEHLDAVVEAMAQLDAPLGCYFVLGNHDYRADAQRITRSFRQADLKMLVNQSVQVEHKGRRITIAGIDYAEKDRQLARLVRHTCKAMTEPDDLRLMLAHHPHAFDAACRYNVDLTLSGHTHGGQFLLRKPHRHRKAIGLGTLAWRYYHGDYRKGTSRLFVSPGLGSSFPLRFRCPAEISVLELQTA